MGDISPTPQQLLIEAVIFWSIGVVLYVGRMISRIIGNGSIKSLYLDDYVMTATFLIYTSLLILIQISARYATNLMDPADYDKVMADPQEVSNRIFGSKIVIGLEQCMLFSTWGVKICMLTMFWRLTKNTNLHRYVKIIAVYVAVGFVIIMVTYYGVYCRPFSQYWAMPVQNLQCATYAHYSITQAVFNISSDAAMLVIPTPLLVKTQLKTRKKALLVCIMSLGIFTIVAAILNKFFNFASPLTTTYQIWYIREASTAIYVANLTCLWPLLRKLFGLKAFLNSSRQYRRQGAQPKKEVSGESASQSAGSQSQSRPSFSLYRALLCSSEYRNSVNGSVSTPNNDGPPQSQEAITKLSVEFLEHLGGIPSYEWTKEEYALMTGGSTRPAGIEAGQTEERHRSESQSSEESGMTIPKSEAIY